MRVIVAYTSKTGFTRTYAEWIAAELDARLVATTSLTGQMVVDADVIIHGGGLRISRVGGLRRFLRHWPQMRDKQVILWHTGANPGRPADVDQVWTRSLTEEQLERTARFYLRGGFDFTRLRGTDRLIMAARRAILSRRRNITEDEQKQLALYDLPAPALDRANIEPLVAFARRL